MCDQDWSHTSKVAPLAPLLSEPNHSNAQSLVTPNIIKNTHSSYSFLFFIVTLGLSHRQGCFSPSSSYLHPILSPSHCPLYTPAYMHTCVHYLYIDFQLLPISKFSHPVTFLRPILALEKTKMSRITIKIYHF